MRFLINGINYLFRNFFRPSAGADTIAQLVVQHLQITAITLVISLLIALPLGVLITRIKWLRGPVLGVLGLIYTIPSLAMFVLLIPLSGLGPTTAVIALVAYAQLVLVRNTTVGLSGVDPAIIEAARGMGMNGWQRFWRVEFPLALPLILAGLRLAAVSVIGIGTIAAFISAGGLGILLFVGVSSGNRNQIIAGGIAVSLLAIIVNILLRFIERRSTIAIRGEE